MISIQTWRLKFQEYPMHFKCIGKEEATIFYNGASQKIAALSYSVLVAQILRGVFSKTGDCG